jgi:hypothetical protein
MPGFSRDVLDARRFKAIAREDAQRRSQQLAACGCGFLLMFIGRHLSN